MTVTTNSSNRATSETFVQRHELLVFFVLAIALSWVFMIVDALGSYGILPFRLPTVLMVVMGYMPTLAAVIVTGVSSGRDGIKKLFKKLLIVRVGARWYAFAIFGFALVAVTAVILYNALGPGPDLPILSRNVPELPGWQLALAIVPMFVVIGLVNGEELAWRGFALPRLQRLYNALVSSVILGVIWTIFHLPLFFTLTGSSQAGMSLFSFTLGTISLSILFTWLYNNTGGSVFLAYIFHASTNTWSQVFSVDRSNQYIDWLVSVLLLILAVGVVLAAGAVNLSRRNLRIQE